MIIIFDTKVRYRHLYLDHLRTYRRADRIRHARKDQCTSAVGCVHTNNDSNSADRLAVARCYPR